MEAKGMKKQVWEVKRYGKDDDDDDDDDDFADPGENE